MRKPRNITQKTEPRNHTKDNMMEKDEKQDKPSFFNIILEGLNTEHLKIPPKFVQFVEKDLSSTAILSGPSGRQREVSICKNKNGIYIQDGWPQFLEDNLVEIQDFLLFTYEEDTRFSVQIFKKSGIEQRSLNKTTADIETDIPSFKRKSGRPRKTCDDSLNLQKYSEEGSLPEGSFRKNQTSAEIGKPGAHKLVKTLISKKIPYFQRFMSKSNCQKGYLLPIPVDFVRENLSQPGKEIILQNTEGKTWEVSRLQNQNCNMLSKGWIKFVHDNEIKINDHCIFELIARDKMRVHIFRYTRN